MNPDDESLVEKIIDFATRLRMGSSIDSAALADLRDEIERAAGRWLANGGVVAGETVAVLLSFYPAMLGATGMHSASERRAIEDLADDLLEELLAAVDPGGEGRD